MKFNIKKFISYYKPYRWLFVKVLLCALVAASITLIYPLGIRYITKVLLVQNPPGAVRPILLIGLGLLGLLVIQTFCGGYFDYQGHVMGAKMESDMRKELFTHLENLSFRYFDNHRVGELMSRITHDTLMLAELYHHGPEDLIIYCVKFFGAMGIMLTINWKMTLVMLTILPIMCGYVLFFSKSVHRAAKQGYERISDINAQIEETFNGIRMVQSFTNEEVEKQKFEQENHRFLKARKRIYGSEMLCYQGIDTFVELMSILIVVIGGIWITKGTMDLADLMTFILYAGYLTDPIRQLTRIIAQYQDGLAGFNRFIELLNTQSEIKEVKNAVELTDVKGQITFEDVSFAYEKDQENILDSISFDIPSGEYTALVGHSGGGKTTLCSLISRFYDISDGRILIDGKDIREVTIESLRRNIGIVQQDVYLFSGTIIDNIRYGLMEASEEEIIQAAKKANAHEFIMAMPKGYHTHIGQKGIKLSGGQKQRISIARAFLKDPAILILDEATSALDSESEKVIQGSLEKLAKGRTTLVIAHRLSTIKNASRILVIDDHRIAEMGTHAQLIHKNGVYAHLYQTI